MNAFEERILMCSQSCTGMVKSVHANLDVRFLVFERLSRIK
jgi:hypothetical protein